MIDKTTLKAYMDILASDNGQLKDSTIKEIKNLVIQGLTQEEKQEQNNFTIKEKKESENIITIYDIKLATCKVFNISMEDLNGLTRKHKISYPRQLAMYLSRKHTGLSYPQIAKAFNRLDHTTIIHAYNKIDLDLNTHAYSRKWVDKIKKVLDI